MVASSSPPRKRAGYVLLDAPSWTKRDEHFEKIIKSTLNMVTDIKVCSRRKMITVGVPFPQACKALKNPEIFPNLFINREKGVVANRPVQITSFFLREEDLKISLLPTNYGREVLA